VTHGAGVLKRLLIGRAIRSEQAAQELLPKRIALAVFASDPLSSVAYATEQILLVLSLGGIALLGLSVPVSLGVVALLAVVILSYRQTVREYSRGGGAYQVASSNFGPNVGLVAASALLVDYVLTVAVSIASGVDNIISAFPVLGGERVMLCVALVALLAVMNLRGIRESGRAFAVPTYCFVLGVLVMIGWGLLRTLAGAPPRAESAGLHLVPEHSYAGLALVVLALRAFSSGCTALTGVEAISNGVPAFRPPKGRNASLTLLALGALAITMFSGITVMALVSGVHVAENPMDLGLPPGTQTRTVIAQIAAATFGGANSIGFYYLTAFTALVLILAANTAFNGFPVLSSLLAHDRFLPRQLHTRGDRLVYSNGILLLSACSAALLWVFHASTTGLIQLYIIGVFLSFTLSQAGMVRHWQQRMAAETDRAGRNRLRSRQLVSALGTIFTGLVLIVVLLSKFTAGAWIVCIAIPLLWVTMRGIGRHYSRVRTELTVPAEAGGLPFPPRNIAIVLVANTLLPTLRALSYARATRPDTLIALTANVDDTETRELLEDWDARELPVPLTVAESPYREITRPVLEFIRRQRERSPRGVITVFIPEYVLGRWWDHLLHNQSALRLKARLLFEPGVMVTSVPWQLGTGHPKDQRARG
jgi:amino acid transporter